MARVLVKSIAVPAYNEATTAWTLGTAGVSATQTFNGGTFKYNDGGTKAVRFNMDTVDGADDYRILISSGGGAGPARGAYVEMHGNEFSSTPGKILWESGSSASGTAVAWQVNVGASSIIGHSIDGNGLNTIGASGGAQLHAINGQRVTLTGNAANAATIRFVNSVADAYIGPDNATVLTGSTDAFVIASTFPGGIRFSSSGFNIHGKLVQGTWTLGTQGTANAATPNYTYLGVASTTQQEDSRLYVHVPINTGSRSVLSLTANTTNEVHTYASFGIAIGNGGDATWAGDLLINTASAGVINQIGKGSSSGAWTFGSATATANIKHIFQGTGVANFHTTLMVQGSPALNSLSVLAAGNAGSEFCALIHDRNITESFLWVTKGGAATFRFVSTTNNSWTSLLTSQAGYLECGSFNVNTGAWKLGADSGTQTHTANGSLVVGSGGSTAIYGGNSAAASVSAAASITITSVGSKATGLLVVRDGTLGSTALIFISSNGTAAVVSNPDSMAISGTSGANQIWVSSNGTTTITITNQYGTARLICATLYGI